MNLKKAPVDLLLPLAQLQNPVIDRQGLYMVVLLEVTIACLGKDLNIIGFDSQIALVEFG